MAALRPRAPRPTPPAAQLAILEEQILPLCTVGWLADADGARIAAEDPKIFHVYAPGELEAQRPRCDRLVEAIQAGS